MFAIAIGLWYVARSDVGAVFNAIRLDEDTVSTAGLNTLRFKLLAFTLSAVVAGIGGVFYTHYFGSISPESIFSVDFLLTNKWGDLTRNQAGLYHFTTIDLSEND